LIIVNASLGQTTNNAECQSIRRNFDNGQFLSIEQRNEAKSVPKFSWPLNSYVKAENFIKSGEPEQAIQLLEKEMTGLFPFRFPATNGYEIYFYYYKLLGDAYSADDNPVEAIDAYRSALSPVPYATITNSPIPYAKCLHNLAKQFMKIYRWADAEEVLKSALQLAQNDRLNADYFWVKTVRFSLLGNNDSASKFAEKCVEFAPDYNWAAWHKLAHSKYASGKRVEAIDAWLDGLDAFQLALPIVDAPKYLNRALPYWKSATDGQIIRYYEILQKLVLANPPTKSNNEVISRLLMEKLKLEKLFPKLLPEIETSTLLEQANKQKKAFKTDENNFLASTNINWDIPNYFLVGNSIEKLINKALYFESKNETEKVRKLYKTVLSKIKENPTNEMILVQGYSPEFFALAHLGFWYAEQEDAKEGMREKALDYERVAEGLVVSNYEDFGFAYCPEEFYRLLMSKGGMAKRSGLPDECFSAWRYASEISPESVDPKQCLLKHEADLARLDSNIEEVSLKMADFFQLPLERPWYKYWHDQAYLYWQLNNMNLWKESETPTKKAIDTMLEGFEIGIFDFSCNYNEFCNANFRQLEDLDLFKDILWHEKAGEFEEIQYIKLYKLIGQFGLTIPARTTETDVLANVLKWQKYFSSVERDYPIVLKIDCNALKWKSKQKVYIWFDFMKIPVKLEFVESENEMIEKELVNKMLGNKNNLVNIIGKNICINEKTIDLWTGLVDIPPGTFLIKYILLKSSEKNDSNKWKKFFISGIPELQVLNCKTDCDFSSTIVFQCSAKNICVSNCIYIVGNQPELGNWQPNKIKMYDDGTHGDKIANDETWSLKISFPSGIDKIEYKFTNSGIQGTWNGEEFSGNKRIIQVETTNILYICSTFGFK